VVAAGAAKGGQFFGRGMGSEELSHAIEVHKIRRSRHGQGFDFAAVSQPVAILAEHFFGTKQACTVRTVRPVFPMQSIRCDADRRTVEFMQFQNEQVCCAILLRADGRRFDHHADIVPRKRQRDSKGMCSGVNATAAGKNQAIHFSARMRDGLRENIGAAGRCGPCCSTLPCGKSPADSFHLAAFQAIE